MDYLEPLGITSADTDKHTEEFIKHGRVRSLFEAMGYKVFAYETKFYWTEWDDADFYLTPRSGSSDRLVQNIQHLVLNEFELLFLKTTMLRAFFDLSDSVLGTLGLIDQDRTIGRAFEELPRRTHYDRTRFILDSLKEISSLDVPKFVFVHIVSPHAPFVFSLDGDFIPEEPQDEIQAYRDQVLFLNRELIDIIEEILAAADPSPIIILQGDHGAIDTGGTVDETKILNAYHLPDKGGEYLYSQISPVNSFRVIFDAYFGTDMGSLDDVSNYRSGEGKFIFKHFPDDRPGCDAGAP
jgi:hypothetical protein